MITLATPTATTPAANHSPSMLSACKSTLGKTIAVLRRVEPYGQSAVLVLLRLIYGWFFIQTGWGKLMNFERTTGFFQSMGLPAPAAMAALVATTELLGGILLAVGAGTRFAAAALSIVLLTAFATTHAAEAFQGLSAFTEQAPYPFLVATLVLLAFGAGRLSLDGWLRSRSSRQHPATTSPTID